MAIQIVFLALIGASCGGSQAVFRSEPRFDAAFASAGLEGAFVLHRFGSDQYRTNDIVRAQTRYLPASTFKIFNALVALETGVVADEREVIRWDGVQRSVEAWNRDHDLASAIRVSAVWYFQELARRIGYERMQVWIDSVGYGNKDIGGGIDVFWLSGNIRISPFEQVQFLERLYRNDLPFSDRSIRIVKEILVLERSDDWVLRGKTGWGVDQNQQIGWFVGYVEREEDVWVFANNITILDDADARHRAGLAREILGMEGILKREAR
jgi:beta-lactamase class D